MLTVTNTAPFHSLNFPVLPTIKLSHRALFSGFVNGLSKYELRYVYHHITRASKLTTKQLMVNGSAHLGLYFQHFLIGTIPCSHISQIGRQTDDLQFQVDIKQIFKRKYLPIESIWVEINVAS